MSAAEAQRIVNTLQNLSDAGQTRMLRSLTPRTLGEVATLLYELGGAAEALKSIGLSGIGCPCGGEGLSGFNFGNLFKKVAQVVAPIAPIAGTFFGPVGMAVGTAVGAVASAASGGQPQQPGGGGGGVQVPGYAGGSVQLGPAVATPGYGSVSTVTVAPANDRCLYCHARGDTVQCRAECNRRIASGVPDPVGGSPAEWETARRLTAPSGPPTTPTPLPPRTPRTPQTGGTGTGRGGGGLLLAAAAIALFAMGGRR